MTRHRTGRNDPCPCGSGKKYKRCHGAAGPSGENRKEPELVANPNPPKPPRTWHPYAKMREISDQRRAEIERIFADELGFIDDCLSLVATLIEKLGTTPPVSIQDVAIRDLGCDAFEFIHEARHVLAENRPSVAFPAMRRAFESTSLCNLFSIRPHFAHRWAQGKEIKNSDVRKALECHPMTDSVEELRETYQFFSRGTHPNRSHVPFLFLGEGNIFTLGSIPPIHLGVLGEQVRYLMQEVFWLAGILAYHYMDVCKIIGPEYIGSILELRPRMAKLGPALTNDLKTLREEHGAEGIPPGLGPQYMLSAEFDTNPSQGAKDLTAKKTVAKPSRTNSKLINKGKALKGA